MLLCGLDEWLLLDRYKWPNNRALRFNWADILDRKDADTLKACAALLHKDCLAPGEGNSLLESLDENAHKHAFGVSEDLKYALREAIELLGNEAARQLREQAADAKKGFFSGKDQLDAGDLSLECLRLVYRLLFMFYIEARPELGYVPIGKSDIYLKGYSLESLRDLEMQPLTTPHAREASTSTPPCAASSGWWPKAPAWGHPPSISSAGQGAAPSPAPAKPLPSRRSTAACSMTAPCRSSARSASPTTSGRPSSA